MALKEKVEVPGPAIRIPTGLASADLHERIERLQRRTSYKEKRAITKAQIVVDLLDSHPKLKSI